MKSYAISIVAAAIVCAVTRTLLPEKTRTGRILRLLSGLLMTITVISPLINFSFANITDYFEDLSIEANTYTADGESAAQNSMAEIIKSQSEAYILDKANRMGVQIAVEVELNEDDNSIPCGVKITGALSPYAKEVISEYIEDALGIAKENQKWT